MECGLEVFGKSTDDRYEYKGDISYKKLYEDNLSKDNQDLVMDDIKDEKVSLYKREFLGIDKECHMKYDITEEQNDELKSNQTMEAACSFFEGIIILSILLFSIVYAIIKTIQDRYNSKSRIETINFFCFLAILLLFIACIIFHSVFLGRIIHYNFSYDCSDPITNELFKIQKENADKIILFNAINLGIDIFIVLIHIALWIMNCFLDEYSSFRIVVTI